MSNRATMISFLSSDSLSQPISPPPEPEVLLISSQRVRGTMWYLFRVCEDGDERFYLKRYTDFAKLDQLVKMTTATRPGRPLPELPGRGLLGVRHRLGIGRFDARRLQGLQEYV